MSWLQMNSKEAFQAERDIAKLLGIGRVAFSGGKWNIGKEDFYDKFDPDNEDSGVYIGQLKSTSGNVLKVGLTAIKSLLQNARITHRKPIFVLNFDKSAIAHPVWVAQPLDHFMEIQRKANKYDKLVERRNAKREG